MAITFVAASTVGDTPESYVTLPIPTGTQSGDLLIALVAAEGGTVNQVWDDDGGGGKGWTRLVNNVTFTGRDCETAIFYKIAGSSESDPTFTYGTDNFHCGVCVAIRGVDTSTPFDVTYNNSNHYAFTQNTASPTCPAITTATNGAWVVVLSAITHDAVTWAAPANYTLRGAVAEATLNKNAGIASREISTAATETPGAWQNSGGSSAAESHNYTLALKPAATGYDLTAAAGSVALSGQAASPLAQRRLPGGHSALTLAGQSAGLLRGFPLTAAQGSLTLCGQSAEFARTYVLAAAHGAADLAGRAANLLYSGGGYILTAAQGGLAATGQAAALVASRVAAPALAGISGAGQAAGVAVGRFLAAAQRSATGAKPGAGLVASYFLAAAQQASSLAGQAVYLLYSGAVTPTPSSRKFVVEAEARTCVVEAQNRTFVVPA